MVKMSYTRYVTSVLLICCLFSVWSGINTARSDDTELYFYPKRKWDVKRLNPDDDSLAICSISNQLNNGYMIEMTGNAEGFNAVNIDFKQNAFIEGNVYDVQYFVPGVSNITLPSKAIKTSLISSDLSEYDDFAKEISRTGVIDIQVKGSTFRLYLTGLEARMAAYNECTGLLKEPSFAEHDGGAEMPSQDSLDVAATGQTAQDSPMLINPVHSDARNDNSSAAEIAENEEHLAPSHPTRQLAPSSLAPPPPSPSAPLVAGEDVAASQSTSHPESSKLSVSQDGTHPSSKDPAPRYIDVLAQKLKRNSDTFKVNSDVRTGDSSLIQNEQTAKQDAEQSPPNIERASTPEPVYNIVKNKEPIVVDFTRGLHSAPASNVPSSPKKAPAAANIASAEKSADIEPAAGTKAGKTINDDAFVQMRNKISSLEQQVISLTEKNNFLDNELKTALKDAEKERLSVSSDNWNLERATMRFNEAERQIQRLGRQLQTQRAQCELEKSELENLLFDPKLTSQQQQVKLSSLETALDQAKSELLRQQRTYEERIKIMEQQLEAR